MSSDELKFDRFLALSTASLSTVLLFSTLTTFAADGIGADKSTVNVQLNTTARVPKNDSDGLARINLLRHDPSGADRLFINDMHGAIWVLEHGVLRTEPFLDLRASRGEQLITKEFELGLLSFAFHPEYAREGQAGFGKIYTVHTETTDSISADSAVVLENNSERLNHYDVLTEWTRRPNNPNRVDPATRREVMRIAQPWWDHNTGYIDFNPNATEISSDFGLLYLGVGDGGNTANRNLPPDADEQAQDLGSPLGKILRINPLQEFDRAYQIPRNNPFFAQDGALAEIYAFGFRNPQHFSWDTGGNNQMIAIDLGQDRYDEVNIVQPGLNYGWSRYEGEFSLVRSDPKAPGTRITEGEQIDFQVPAIQYGRDLGVAIAGGFVYRGRGVPNLRGKYIFGDIASGALYYVNMRDLIAKRGKPVIHSIQISNFKNQSLLDELGTSRADLRVATDAHQELYILSKQDGVIRRIDRSVIPSNASSTTDVVTLDNNESSLPISAWHVKILGLATLTAFAFLSFVLLAFSKRNRNQIVSPAHARRDSRNPRRERSARNPTMKSPPPPISTYSYHSKISECILEIDAENEQLTIRRIGSGRSDVEIALADIERVAVFVNDDKIAESKREPGRVLSKRSIDNLRKKLAEIESIPVNYSEIRNIEIRVYFQSKRYGINFYSRSGKYRRSRYSYKESIDHIALWYEAIYNGNVEPLAMVAADDREEQNDAVQQTLASTGSFETKELSVAEQLREIADLRAQGVLDEREFKAAKNRILGKE